MTILLGLVLAPIAALAAETQQMLPEMVVARRGGVEVTLADIDAKVAVLPPEARARFLDNPQRIESTVSNLLLLKQLAAEAKAAGLDKDVSTAAQIRYAEAQVLAGAQVKKLAEKAPKLDALALAKENYLSDPKRFNTPDTLIARHVLIRTTAARSDDEAKKLAEKVRGEALAGKPIAELAKTYSEDEGSKAEGGLLPEFKPGQMQKPFEEAAFELNKPGQTSGVVKTKFGYHVIQLVERKPGKPRKFEEVKDELVKKLTDENAQRFQKEHMDQLQSMAIDADPKVVESLRTRYAGAEAPTAAAMPEPGAASDTK